MYRCLGLIFLCLLFGCSTDPKQANTNKQQLDLLLEKAVNNNNTLPERLQAAVTASKLSDGTRKDSIYLFSINEIAAIYRAMDSPGKAITYFKKAIAFTDSVHDKKGMGIALHNLGIVYNETGIYDSALICYKKANALFVQTGDSIRSAQTLISTGVWYKDQGDFKQAFRHTLAAVGFIDSLKSYAELSTAYTTLGNVLKEMGEFDQALSYHQKAMRLRISNNDSNGIGGALNNIANVYKTQKKYQLARDYYLRALTIKKRYGNRRSLAITIDNLAETSAALHLYGQAESYFLEALELRQSVSDLDGYLTTSNKLARLYFTTNNTGKAEEWAENTRAKMPETGMAKQKLDNETLLSEIYGQTGRYEAAWQSANKALALKDSLFRSDMSHEISLMNTRFQTREREKELLLARQLETVQSERIHFQRKFIILLVSLAVLLLTTIVLLYRSNKSRKLLMNELNHRVSNNLQLISDMVYLQMDRTDDKQVSGVLSDTQSRLEAMNVIHRLFYRTGYRNKVSARDFIQSLVNNQHIAFDNSQNQFRIITDIDDRELSVKQAINIGLIINELITNIYKHGIKKEDPELNVVFKKQADHFQLLIKDNCVSWQANTLPSKDKSFGLSLVNQLIQQMNGKWETSGSEEGTLQVIRFPC